VTGFKECDSLEKLHLRAVRAFLGAPKNACNAGVQSEVNLLLPKFRTKLEMIRYLHRLRKMPENRLPYRILQWDIKLNEMKRISTWSDEVKTVFEECDLLMVYESELPFNVKETVQSMSDTLMQRQSQILERECSLKPKLRTFMTFKDFNFRENYTYLTLSFFQRRTLGKFRLGCLPLRLETGRYQVPRLPEDQRICLACDTENEVENESHFMFQCGAYKDERDSWLSKMTLPENFIDQPDADKFKVVLNNPTNVKHTANFIIAAFHLRGKIIH